ncbi:MAG: hypothetical protein JWP10_912, partial [Nocardioidaceae bacterium]|nr:hypothetical protein [Nocardioidaceae bacterium]
TENWFTNIEELDAVTLIPQVNESWINKDGSRTTIEHRGEALAADGRGAPENGLWDTLPVKDKSREKAKSHVANFASNLPTDSAKLSKVLHNKIG